MLCNSWLVYMCSGHVLLGQREWGLELITAMWAGQHWRHTLTYGASPVCSQQSRNYLIASQMGLPSFHSLRERWDKMWMTSDILAINKFHVHVQHPSWYTLSDMFSHTKQVKWHPLPIAINRAASWLANTGVTKQHDNMRRKINSLSSSVSSGIL